VLLYHRERAVARLDRKDTLILKGLAIASIALHNYYHLLGPVKENEFEFDPVRFTVFLQTILDPRQSVQAFFSFLGHYGVQVFVFLSAYGLAKSHWDTPEHWKPFMWSRARKIYPTFFVAVFAWALSFRVLAINPLQQVGPVVLTALGVENVVPGLGLPPVGPWWFLPFIMQFYCLWLGIRWIVKRYQITCLILLSVCSIASLYIANDLLVRRWSINLLETPIGHLSEICLGIFAARYGMLPGKTAGLIGGVLLLAGNANRAFWPLSCLGALLLILWLYQIVPQRLKNLAFLRDLGSCSMALFFINGIVRMPFLSVAQQKPWLWALLLGFASTALGVLIAHVLTPLMLGCQVSSSTSLPKPRASGHVS
jgi:peptidoglycan/LPS O-acetylase OafA/YrhL